MPRTLVMRQVTIAAEAQADFLDTMRQHRAAARAQAAHHWLFVHETQPGHFTEFVEAGDPERLAAVLAALPPRAPAAPTEGAFTRWIEFALD